MLQLAGLEACFSSFHLTGHPPSTHLASRLALPSGVPTTPSITASGGGLSSANITWSASPTTAYYLVELLYQGVVKKSARVDHRWAGCIRRVTGLRKAAGLCRSAACLGRAGNRNHI